MMKPIKVLQPTLTLVEQEDSWDCYVRILTQWLPDGRVRGFKEVRDKGGCTGAKILMTETEWQGWQQAIEAASEWDKVSILRYLCCADSSNGGGMFHVIPDHLWGTDCQPDRQPEPVVEVLQIGKDKCPGLASVSLKWHELLHRFGQRNKFCRRSLCSKCENLIDLSDSFVVCDHTDRIRMYPYVEWGPMAPDYPQRKYGWEDSSTKPTDEYIQSHYRNGHFYFDPEGV